MNDHVISRTSNHMTLQKKIKIYSKMLNKVMRKFNFKLPEFTRNRIIKRKQKP